MANPAMFSWQQPLAAIFGGLSAAAQPGGFSNFGAGVNQTMQQQQQAAAQQQIAELRDLEIKQQEEAMRRANKEAADREATGRQLAAMLGGSPQPSPVQPVGNYGAATGGIQTASAPGQAAMFQNWTPEQRALITQYAQNNPDAALGFLTEQAFAQPDTPKAASEIGQIMADVQAGFITPEQAQERIAKMNYIAPQQAPQGEAMWEPYIDPKSGRTGQKNTRTGKIDWDPGNTMMVQTGTDANGNPIYDFVSTPAGKPPSEANIQAGIRGTLVEGAIENIRDIAKNAAADISPLRMAAADSLGEKGPLGAYGANVLRSDDEKKYSAAISKGVEGLVAAITGAGVAKDQFPRIQNLIPGPTDSPDVINWKLDQLMPILDTLIAGSGPLAMTKNATPAQGGPKAPSEMTDDELMKELGQ